MLCRYLTLHKQQEHYWYLLRALVDINDQNQYSMQQVQNTKL